MLHFSKPMFRQLLALMMLVIALPTFATVKNIKPGTAFIALEPTKEHTMTTQQVLNTLVRGHYESKKIDDDLSSHVLDLLLKDLVSTHSYFLASDIKEFEKYRYKLDDALKRGDMRPAFFIYNRFQQRVNERLTFLDRKSTRLNSSHVRISYAVFCLKKKKKKNKEDRKV